MNVKIKLAAYVVLIALAIWFGRGFYSNYTTVAHDSAVAATNDATAASSTENPPVATNDSNQAPTTDSSTNAAGAPATNVPPPVKAAAKPASPHAAQGTMIAYLAAMVGALIGLGLLIAYDVTQYVGGVAVDAMFDDQGEGARDPEYEKAEQVWANGDHLEAIRLMREFLKKDPHAQYAALRIAEIYEKDLNNVLAAALEYEEILKKKLPAERWGWAAIHLCNLYSKLGQQDKTRALLQRIIDEYPQTAAAKKARSRLGLAEPEPEPAEGTESAPPPAEKQEPEPPSNLPPGFRPKNK